MLLFFRSNQFFVAIPLAIYVLLVHLGALLGAIQPPATVVKGGMLYQSCFGWAAGEPFYSALAAAILVFFQAILINVLADEFRLMNERTWFPGLFYALTVSALPDFLFVSAPLVAATFVPMALWRVYSAFQKPGVTAAIFDSALWIGVASLFYPPAIWLLVAAFAGLEVVRVFRIHERFIFLIGIFVALFLSWLGYFWADKGGEFRSVQWGDLFHWYSFNAAWDDKMILKTILVVSLGIVLFIGLSSVYSRKGIQSQKFASVQYWFLGVGALTVLTRPEWHWEQLLLPASIMGILVALSFQSLRDRRFAELGHLLILAFVLIIQFADFFLNLAYSLF